MLIAGFEIEMANLKADLAVANEQCEELEFYRQATAELREQVSSYRNTNPNPNPNPNSNSN